MLPWRDWGHAEKDEKGGEKQKDEHELSGGSAPYKGARTKEDSILQDREENMEIGKQGPKG